MIAGLSLGSDNKRYFRGNLPRLAIITIILMPLLYGAMYLWAFWNPFNEVNKIPAAIVNLDKGATEDGKPLHAGRKVVKSLIESGQLDLTEVSAEEAAEGLAHGDFYFTITLPKNFSKAIVSPSGQDPFKGQVQFRFNDANNYLATIIGQDASQQVINKVNATIGATVVDKVLVMIEGAGAKLGEAVTGADKLSAGTVKLNNGVGELKAQLDQVITPALTDLGSSQTTEINNQIAYAVGQAESALSVVTALANSPLAAAANDAVGLLEGSSDPGARQVGRNLATANRNFANDVAGARQMSEQAAGALHAVEQKLDVNSSTSLQAQLREIERQIDAKLTELQSGLVKLASGTGQLESGMSELQSGLEQGLAQVPKWTRKQREQTAKTLSSPVSLIQTTENEADTFGTGFAPFFSSLALFVGAILCWMLLTPLQSRPVVSGLGPFRTAIVSYLPALIVGALQATVLFLVIKFGLGLNATHPVGMWLFMILMSAAFLAIIQTFDAVFDIAIGRVVTLAFLMVALISAGGIYPVPTTAGPFQVIHPFDPMTYTVNGLRQLTVAHSIDSRLWIAIAVLTGIILVAITITAWVAKRNRQYTMERLYPSIEV